MDLALPDQQEDEVPEKQIFVGNAVSSVLKEYGHLLQSLHTDVSQRAAKPVERAARSIKSAAYNMADAGTYEAALRVEQPSYDENFRCLPPALHKLKGEFRRLHVRLFGFEPSANRVGSSFRARVAATDAKFAHYGIVVADRI